MRVAPLCQMRKPSVVSNQLSGSVGAASIYTAEGVCATFKIKQAAILNPLLCRRPVA